jgi:hypothetical protein
MFNFVGHFLKHLLAFSCHVTPLLNDSLTQSSFKMALCEGGKVFRKNHLLEFFNHQLKVEVLNVSGNHLLNVRDFCIGS